MAATATGDQVYIGATTGDLAQGLQQAIADVRGAVVEMRAQLANIGKGAKPAAKEVEGLGEKMRDFARGQRRDAGAARYYVNELAAVLPVGAQTRDLLGSLTAGLVGGGGFALALEGTMFLLRQVSAAFTEASEAQKKAREESEKHAKALHDLAFEAEQAALKAQGVPASLLAIRESADKYAQERAPLLARQAKIGETLSSLFESDGGGGSFAEGLRREADQIALELQRIGERQKEAAKKLRVELGAEEQAARDKAIDSTRTVDAQLLAIRQKTMGEEERIRSEAEARAAEVAVTHAAAGAAKIGELQTAIRGDAERQIRDLREASDVAYWDGAEQRARAFVAKMSTLQPLADEAVRPSFGYGTAPKKKPTAFPEVAFGGNVGSEEGDAAGVRAAATAEQLRQIDDLNAQILEKQRAAGKEIADAYVGPMSQAFSSFVASAITQQGKLRDNVKAMMGQIVKTVIDGAMKQALAEKALGTTRAAAANAYNPIAAAAAAALFGGIATGLIAKMPSARGGWSEVERDTVALVHKKEMVLSADIAEPLRQMLRGGGFAGAAPRISLGFFDPAHAQNWLDTGGMEQFLERWQRFQRDGRA